MASQSFSAVLERLPGDALWTVLVVPFNVPEVLGKKGTVNVRGTLNGHPFRRSLHTLDGERYHLMISKEIRDAAGLTPGEPVQVVLELDPDERTVETPPDLAAALSCHSVASEAWDKLAKSRRYEFVQWLNSTKNPQTRQNRIERTLEMCADGVTLRPARKPAKRL